MIAEVWAALYIVVLAAFVGYKAISGSPPSCTPR